MYRVVVSKLARYYSRGEYSLAAAQRLRPSRVVLVDRGLATDTFRPSRPRFAGRKT